MGLSLMGSPSLVGEQKIYYHIFPLYSFIILMSTNGQQLNSEAIARYLTIIAANQRKLQYCREILSANPAFVPLSYFQQAQTANKGQINRQSIRNMLENLNESYEEQQAALIYSYFCIDEKSYVTFDQFYAAIIPKNNPSISKIVEKRENGSFCLDYSLRFAFSKFYAQVYETQYQLQMKRMFAINIDSSNFRTKDGMRLSVGDIEQYLADHSRFPTKPMIKLLHAEINANKGGGRRNLSIRTYIKKYLEMKRLQKGQLPLIQISLPRQHQKQSVNLRLFQGPSNTSSRPSQKKMSQSPAKRTSAKQNKLNNENKFAVTPQVSLMDVEKRIRSLLSIVQIKPNIPVIRWGSHSSLKQQTVARPGQTQSIQHLQLRNKEPFPKQQQRQQAAVPLLESLRYSSIKVDPLYKNQQAIGRDQPEQGRCLTERETSFGERQQLRKRFKLAQQSMYTPCRRLQDSSTPTVSKAIEVERVSEARQGQEGKSQEKTPQRKVFNYSEQKRLGGESTSRYKKYSYLNDSRSSLANRISYLKQLVSSPTKPQNYTSSK